MLAHPELLDRVFRLSTGSFSAELACEILKLEFPPADQARYEELSEKAQAGTLTPAEQEDLDDYLNLNDFLIILKTKASESLKQTNSAA